MLFTRDFLFVIIYMMDDFAEIVRRSSAAVGCKLIPIIICLITYSCGMENDATDVDVVDAATAAAAAVVIAIFAVQLSDRLNALFYF